MNFFLKTSTAIEINTHKHTSKSHRQLRFFPLNPTPNYSLRIRNILKNVITMELSAQSIWLQSLLVRKTCKLLLKWLMLPLRRKIKTYFN